MILNQNLNQLLMVYHKNQYYTTPFILVYINDLPVYLNTMPRLFADDTALLIHESLFSKMESLMKSELTNILK